MKTYNDLIKWLEALSPIQLDEDVRVIPWGENHDYEDNALYWLDFAGCRDRLSFEVAEQGVFSERHSTEKGDFIANKIVFLDDTDPQELSDEEIIKIGLKEDTTPVEHLVYSGMPYIKLEKIGESKLD